MTAGRLKVLIIGGYGTFGGRLARLLADEARLTLIIAGRSLTQAQDFCTRLQSKAETIPLAFDRDGDVERQMSAVAPDLVVDATGPFQLYGANPYRVVEAALALGINYLDLADGSDFVKGIARFDAPARARGTVILAGVSSFPVLTAAVTRRLMSGMARLVSVTGGIAPSPHARVGMNVIRAIASYAGRPVKLLRDGRWTVGYALIDSKRYVVAPPGRLPLWSRRFSLVDVPDLQVIPDLWPELRSVWMGAGPVPEIWHRVLSTFAWAVRLKLARALSPVAGLMHRTMRWLTFGEHRGGMFIAAEGVGPGGEKIERSWHMLAEGDDGPLIPSMGCEAIIRRWLEGKVPTSGARPATVDIELADYEELFARRRITTGFWPSRTGDQGPLYRRVLGDAWDELPPPLQVMHSVDGTRLARGMASVERGTGLLARILAWLFGFPPSGEDVPVTVEFSIEGNGERWRRSFGERTFASVQEPGRGRFERLLAERFGPFCFGMALVTDGERLRLVLRGWSFAGLPLPPALGPRSDAYEYVEQGRFRFHVEIAHSLTGLIVRYHGWLVPCTTTEQSGTQG